MGVERGERGATRRRILAGLAAGAAGALAGLIGWRPAYAQGQGDEPQARSREMGGTPPEPPALDEYESAPPDVDPGAFKRPATVEPRGREPGVGPRPR